ncbi:MAP/microtubule affinity-regulating kinase 3 [Nowakowskiella sp. JEL0078]|nr:MAP/microtubule affinity-regulating kinase 3 [Nowakowskiella sp. JEL0078]
MLVLEPSKRVTVEDIKKEKWITDGLENEPLQTIPIFNTVNLLPEQHELVLDELEDIGIDRETAIKSLSDNSYDHITATYFLIADKNCKRNILEPKDKDRLIQGSLADNSATTSASILKPVPNKNANFVTHPTITAEVKTVNSGENLSNRQSSIGPPVLPGINSSNTSVSSGNFTLPKQNKTQDSGMNTIDEDGSKSSAMEHLKRLNPIEPEPVARSGTTHRPTSRESSASHRRKTVSQPPLVSELRKEISEVHNSNNITPSQPVESVSNGPPIVRRRPHVSTRDRPMSFAGVPTQQIIPQPNAFDTNTPNLPISLSAVSQSGVIPNMVPEILKDRLEHARVVASPMVTSSNIGVDAGSALLTNSINPRITSARKRAQTINSTSLLDTIDDDFVVSVGASGKAIADLGNMSQVLTSDIVAVNSSRTSVSEKLKNRLRGRENKEKNEPRVLRFTFSVSTTSNKDPDLILAEICRVLVENSVTCETIGFVCLCSAAEGLEFEIEVCKLPRLSMSGLRFKRMAGNSWAYKNLLTELISKMNL